MRHTIVDLWRVFGHDFIQNWPSDVLGPTGGKIWWQLARIAGILMDIDYMLNRMTTQLSNLLDGTNYYVPPGFDEEDEEDDDNGLVRCQ